ncbi:MAG: type II secretion system protein [Porticoccaceae bacterium]|jgi:prepilin-type N-terminal cleavage/methylation domain-containing protein|nr:type II secretion system protein [Porticoccaceae bacterium]|tara:strand:- start:26043 stop:26609 length:567 start_codon:yes stop_codon:yes gene_type:complete
MKRSQGFTLIELLIVVAIVVILSAISGLAINQAFDRRYSAEADKLLIWMHQLSERSSLEGVAYGIITETDNDRRETTQLRAVVYFKNRWIAVTSPEPFVLGIESNIDWDMDMLEELLPQSQSQALGLMDSDELKEAEKEFLLPEMAFLPDAYIEPQGAIQLSFESSELIYSFVWDDEVSTMILKADTL